MNPDKWKGVAKKIVLWLYGPDDGLSEGLVRTLKDKIETALREAYEQGLEDAAKVASKFIYDAEPPELILNSAWTLCAKRIEKAILKLKESSDESKPV